MTDRKPTHWILHDHPLRPDQWQACAYPERPADNHVAFDLFCPGCFAAAEVHALTGVWNTVSEPGKPIRMERLSDTIARHVALHGRPTPAAIFEFPPPGTDPTDIVTWSGPVPLSDLGSS